VVKFEKLYIALYLLLSVFDSLGAIYLKHIAFNALLLSDSYDDLSDSYDVLSAIVNLFQ
jgi:hypothetical protein